MTRSRRWSDLRTLACLGGTRAELMKPGESTGLRNQVEKWLAAGAAIPVRVTAFSRTQRGRRRYVRVEASSPQGEHALFFFRHDDGHWRVFPPDSA